MIAKIVAAILRVPVIVVAVTIALVAAGLLAYKNLDIEAYPNPIPPMIEIITQPSGWSAEEVERYVTIPLETGLNGMLDLEHIRSQSTFGLSDVKCYFSWNADYYTAQQRVLNRIAFINLPAGMKPQLSPWSAIGEVYRYVLRGKGYTLSDLKTAQDWVLEKQFRQVPGVIDVVSFGGRTKQYQVDVDPYRLKGHNLALSQLMTAIGNANANVGGQRLTLGEQSFNVRGIGLIRSLRDIGDVVVAEAHGVPVRVRDVAAVLVGAAPRLGIVGKDDEPDVVQGVVLMRYGGDTLKTLEGVHSRVSEIKRLKILPPGMEIDPYYDRSTLVHVTTHTVLENLLIGLILVTLVLWLFLGHVRAALITAINIPLALLVAFIGMVTTGTPANLISLGAVDFGIVVESTVIMVENVFRHLGGAGQGTLKERILTAAREVGPPIATSTLILAVAFIPLFTMRGAAGVIFSPMAYTYAFAIGGALVLALSLTPVLAARALKVREAANDEEHEEDWLMRALHRFYRPLFRFSVSRQRVATLVGGAIVAVGLIAGIGLGREFMPKLEEGNFWIRATLPTSISLEQSARYVGRMRSILLGCPDTGPCTLETRRRPEIRTVVSQLGRPDDGTDISGFHNVEIFAPLQSTSEWRSGVTKASLTSDLSRELRGAFPGVDFNFSQMIADNVEEAMSGVKGENTIKVVGPDLHVNESKAEQILGVMSGVHGVEDLGIFRSLGQPNVRITPNRVQCGRYGLNVGDVEAVVQAAIGGQAVTEVFEGEKRFDLTVRWAAPFRKDLGAIRNILVATPGGIQVPLGQVAEVAQEEGPSIIYREDNWRYTPVKFSVRGRDLGSTVGEGQRRIDQRIRLPYDTHLEWAGEMNQLQETSARLAIILPLTLILIAFLVYSSVKDWRDTLIVLSGIPVACSGGVLALHATGTNFSISAAMGFISILGVAVQDALIVVGYARRLWNEGHGIEEGALMAAERGLRPVLMTAFVAMIGLLPAALSRGIGSETQKPLAIVVIGGALSLVLLPRLLQPALLVLAHKRTSRAGSTEAPA